MLSMTGAFADGVTAEMCPTCLFPHGNEVHMSAIPETPTMYPPVTVPYSAQSAPETIHEEDIDMMFSIGATSGKLSWGYWLDCMAPTGLEKDAWIVDARFGLSFRKTDLFSFGFEAGALLHLDGKGSVASYDIPLTLKMALVPEAGIIGFPIRLGIGVFTGFSPITREVSFGTATDASVGLLVRMGEYFSLGVDTKVETLMRLDVDNGYDSTFELIWIPAVVTLGIRF